MTEQEKVFNNAREMFMTDGWRDLMEDLQVSLDSITVEALNDEQSFWIAKGQINILRSILGYQEMMLAAEQQEEGGDDEAYL